MLRNSGRLCTALCVLCASVAVLILGGGIQASPESFELYYAAPAAVPELSESPMTLVGVFPLSTAITQVETAAAAYRVYVGNPPWTEANIAPFRLGPGDTVITAYDPFYANEMHVTLPAFTPPGWVDVEVVDLHSEISATLYAGIEIVASESREGEGEGESEGGGAGGGGGYMPDLDGEEEGTFLPLQGSILEGTGGMQLQGASSDVWVNFDYIGRQEGTELHPFNRLSLGAAAVAEGGTVHIMAGVTNEIAQLTKAMTLNSVGGTVQIGNQSAPPPGRPEPCPCEGWRTIQIEVTGPADIWDGTVNITPAPLASELVSEVLAPPAGAAPLFPGVPEEVRPTVQQVRHTTLNMMLPVGTQVELSVPKPPATLLDPWSIPGMIGPHDEETVVFIVHENLNIKNHISQRYLAIAWHSWQCDNVVTQPQGDAEQFWAQDTTSIFDPSLNGHYRFFRGAEGAVLASATGATTGNHVYGWEVPTLSRSYNNPARIALLSGSVATPYVMSASCASGEVWVEGQGCRPLHSVTVAPGPNGNVHAPGSGFAQNPFLAPDDTLVRVVVYPDSGYRLSNIITTAAPYSGQHFMITEDTDIQVEFAQKPRIIAEASIAEPRSPDCAGYIVGVYEIGDTQVERAIAPEGYNLNVIATIRAKEHVFHRFVQWTGTGNDAYGEPIEGQTDTDLHLWMNGDQEVYALFEYAPIELFQDDRRILITDGDLDEDDIPDNVATISATPSMPSLTARVPNGLAGEDAEWRLHVEYTRVAHADHPRDDQFWYPLEDTHENGFIPLDQNLDFTPVFGTAFIGGDCTLSMITCGQPQVDFQFRIRGINPEDATAIAYIESVDGHHWYAAAIARHESLSGGEYFSQFNPFHTANAGEPNWGGPDGWGIMQVDGSDDDPVSTAQLWNWNENVNEGIDRINEKEGFAEAFFDAVERTYPDEYEDPPEETSFGNSTILTAMEACTIQLYNGGAVLTPLLDRYNQLRSFRSCWRFTPTAPTGSKWEFVPNQWDYVERVIEHHEILNP